MAENVKKYLDITGLSTFWNKVKTDYIDVNAKAIADEITRAKAAEKGNADAIAAETAARAEAISNLSTTLTNAYTAADSTLETKVTNAYTAADSTLETKVTNAYTAADSTLKGELNTEIAKKVNQSTYEAKVGELESADSTMAGQISDLQAADSTMAGQISDLQEAVGNMASDSTVSNLQERVTTLEGSDAGKSAREIVQDEVTKQLKSENISESFDTLKEMAEYLSSHPQSVTEMNTAIKANADAIAAETASRTEAEAGLQKAISDETTRATGVEAEIRREFAAADTALKSELNTAIGKKVDQSDYDTKVGELEADILAKVDQSTYDAKVSALESADSSLDTRVKALENADFSSAISNAISGEKTARENQDNKIEAAIGLAADGSHVTTTGNYTSSATTVVGEISALDAQVKVNADAIANEITRAKAAEAQTLADAKAHADEKVAAEKTARESADNTLDGKIAAEATARSEADADLQDAIDSEAEARANADTALDTKISNEATARANADTALGERITALETFKDNTESVDYVTETEWESRAISTSEIEALFTA